MQAFLHLEVNNLSLASIRSTVAKTNTTDSLNADRPILELQDAKKIFLYLDQCRVKIARFLLSEECCAYLHLSFSFK
ncbi:hypothetical protein [Neochlamydia sp. AcF95]|uniref:hypothetical protein n=1 Tax=Neochlamydia sp. AcF95 TaxID=2795734 RepID=UPI001BC904CE|nr:hypothetical protein [Neochlamydia sp. AcF95]